MAAKSAVVVVNRSVRYIEIVIKAGGPKPPVEVGAQFSFPVVDVVVADVE